MTWETNVLVPASAHTALEAIRSRRGFRSRNETVARLLEEYIADQHGREPDQMLVHIATLLRYPLTRREARANHGSHGRQLRVRCDKDLWDTARGLAFRLPGQSAFRGHSDYQARLGTDAILTAITRVERLPDAAVGSHQLLTRRQANGLWRMAVESTRTAPERDVARRAEAAAKAREIAGANSGSDAGELSEVERVHAKLEREIAWHERIRFGRVAAIVQDRLSGDDASEFLTLLDEQDRDSERWGDELARYQIDLDKAELDPVVLAGRGATAVWRAERAVQIEDTMAWIRSTDRSYAPLAHTVLPPGWRLRSPSHWIPTCFRDEDGMPEWRDRVEAGQVLHFVHAGEHVLWPTRIVDDGTTIPIGGFAIVIDEAKDAAPQRIIEAALLEVTHPETDLNVHQVHVPAHVAHDLGLITIEDRDQLVAASRASTSPEIERDERATSLLPPMSLDLIFADLDNRCRSESERKHARMTYAYGPRAFLQYLTAIGHPARSSEWLDYDSAAWIWPVTTLADEVETGRLGEDAVRWLVAYLITLQYRILNEDMEERWKTAALYTDGELDEIYAPSTLDVIENVNDEQIWRRTDTPPDWSDPPF